MNHLHITDAEIEEARGWISECDWSDVDDVDDLSVSEILRGIANNYDGGWAGFLADGVLCVDNWLWAGAR